ncbi:long-chain-fatty-acid--CoA ligase [Gonapodya prolifera JEL478]|uniref:Long-chain-fatty-acid--CoA ligase n=1 Tax=Gonapodya prolifera (strain JEL478) TaxID=1344416 RepID=A0A139A9D5_GONPJ|nr:long-chain-fatty-acid--CoA ligase [Gonapodya prolifera JEL478]|eukprot:KXS13278.1 long-chain-fatty-acid--CoA ligase [Gonapodya prolifera JEL478]
MTKTLTLPRIPLLERAANHARAARSPALVVLDGSEFGYAQLLRDASELAAKLLDGKSDLAEARVTYLVQPSYLYTVIQWAIWIAGGIAVPLAVSHPPSELLYTITDSQSAIVIHHSSFSSKIAEIRAQIPESARVIELEDIAAQPWQGAALDEEVAWTEFDVARRALFIYTSGTTGKPKGAVHTHLSLTTQAKSLSEAWSWTEADRIFNPLPLHHIHGLVNILYCCQWNGAVQEFGPTRFDPKWLWKRFSSPERNLTLFMAVPTIYARLAATWETLEPSERAKATTSCSQFRLMVSGSAPLPSTMFDKWVEVSGHRLLERYGMTETGMMLSNPYAEPRIPATVGHPLPYVSVRLISPDTGTDVTEVVEGDGGEVRVRGDILFKEYWGRPEATKDTFDEDGWFKTGDIACRTKDGYFRIMGRASMDIIKMAGYKLSSLEIEREILDHPDVSDAAVLGVDDPANASEKVAVVLVPKTPESPKLTVAQLKDFLRERLAPYKIPTEILYEKEMPRNPLGKVNKKELRKVFEKKA